MWHSVWKMLRGWRERAREKDDLVSAIACRDPGLLESMLRAGANPNLVVDGYSLLTRAVAVDRRDLVAILLQYGARPDAAGNDALLGSAAEHGNREMIALGLKLGLDLHRRPRGGLTPLEEAVSANDLEMIDYLVEMGARSEELRWVRWFCVSSLVILRLAQRGIRVPEEYKRLAEEGQWGEYPLGPMPPPQGGEGNRGRH